MKNHYCDCGGWVVGAGHDIPIADFDFSWGVSGPIIGCNNLRCSRCNTSIRTATTAVEWRALNAPGAPLPGDGERVYVCACEIHVEDYQRALHESADWNDDDAPNWECGGHRRLALPEKIDGVALAADSDGDALVAAHLSGAGISGAPRFVTQYPSAWIHRLLHLFSGTPLVSSIGKAAAARLIDADLHIRAAAVDLFRRDANAPGAAEVVAVLRDHSELYVGAPNPYASGENLDQWLQVAVAQRAETGDTEALAVIKQAALQVVAPVQSLLCAIVNTEPAWLHDHATDVLRAHPSRDVARRLLYVMAPVLGEELVGPAIDMGMADLISRNTYLDLVRQLVCDQRGERIRDALI